MATNAASAVMSEMAPAPSGGLRLRVVGGRLLMPLCMLAMGVSAFPICETLLLQTAMFTSCFDFSGYYGLATLALFIPGLPIMIAQNSYDQKWDGVHGTRTAAIFRVILGHTMQLAALAVFLALLYDDASTDAKESSKHWLLIICFAVVGLGCAIVYGTYAQTVSMFPERYHPFFFIGTYLVSWVVAPVNMALGELCELRDADGALLDIPVQHWNRIFGFYGISSVLNVGGAGVFVMFTCRAQVALKAFATKDDQLRAPMLLSQEPSVAEWLSGAEGNSPISSAKHLQKAVSVPPSSRLEVWKRCSMVGSVMAVGLLENLLVCGEYSQLQIQGQLPSLRTMMMYSYYAAQCIGACVAMQPAVAELLTLPLITALTLLRLPGVVLIYAYNGEPCPVEGRCAAGVHPCPPVATAPPTIPFCGSSLLFENDITVLIFYTLCASTPTLLLCSSTQAYCLSLPRIP